SLLFYSCPFTGRDAITAPHSGHLPTLARKSYPHRAQTPGQTSPHTDFLSSNPPNSPRHVRHPIPTRRSNSATSIPHPLIPASHLRYSGSPVVRNPTQTTPSSRHPATSRIASHRTFRRAPSPAITSNPSSQIKTCPLTSNPNPSNADSSYPNPSYLFY